MKPDLRCYHHPEREATSQCDRCGDYLCSECVNEHDELHVCARCLEDITPRDEIGMSAKIACAINALACSVWLILAARLPHVVRMETLLVTSAIMSLVALLLALIHMGERASGELLFRWSIVVSGGGSALVIASAYGVSSGAGEMLLAIVCFALVLASIVLVGASGQKGAKPGWALVVALLPPLMGGALLLRICL